MEEEEEGGGGEEGEEEECVAEGTADTPTVPVTPAPVKKRRPYDMTKRRQKAAERAAALGLPPPPAAPPKAASHSTDAGPSAATAAATSGVKRRRESEVKSRRDSDAGTRRHDGEDAEYDLAAARKSMLLSRGGEHNGIARVARPKNVFARERKWTASTHSFVFLFLLFYWCTAIAVPALMYGFGDSVTPYKESMELIEEALVDFVTEVTTKAVEIGEGRYNSIHTLLWLVASPMTFFLVCFFFVDQTKDAR